MVFLGVIGPPWLMEPPRKHHSAREIARQRQARERADRAEERAWSTRRFQAIGREFPSSSQGAGTKVWILYSRRDPRQAVVVQDKGKMVRVCPVDDRMLGDHEVSRERLRLRV